MWVRLSPRGNDFTLRIASLKPVSIAQFTGGERNISEGCPKSHWSNWPSLATATSNWSRRRCLLYNSAIMTWNSYPTMRRWYLERERGVSSEPPSFLERSPLASKMQERELAPGSVLAGQLILPIIWTSIVSTWICKRPMRSFNVSALAHDTPLVPFARLRRFRGPVVVVAFLSQFTRTICHEQKNDEFGCRLFRRVPRSGGCPSISETRSWIYV